MVCNCNGSGLIPFINKDGKFNGAYLDCECKIDQPEVYCPITPSDFDFACSDSYRSYFFERYGFGDPAKVQANKFIIHEVESKEPVKPAPVKPAPVQPAKAYSPPVKTFENDKRTGDGMQKIGYRGIK